MTKLRWEIIPILAETSLNMSAAANRLYIHKTTAKYHAEMIREETGLDPRNFYDLVRLLTMIQSQDNAEWRDARKRLANIDDQTMDALERIGRRSHGGCKDE